MRESTIFTPEHRFLNDYWKIGHMYKRNVLRYKLIFLMCSHVQTAPLTKGATRI